MIDFYERTCINEYSVRLRPWMHVNYLSMSLEVANQRQIKITSYL